LDKDIYKIRKAFTCKPGNTLIVADYGQLELRLLAHISSCRSMLHAFAVGGDFHSRTAMGMSDSTSSSVYTRSRLSSSLSLSLSLARPLPLGMYPEIAKKLETGEVLLEWDSSKGQAPAPLLKDVYSTERRKAKMLNFSIAYGKTAMGIAFDLQAPGSFDDSHSRNRDGRSRQGLGRITRPSQGDRRAMVQ